MNYLQGVPAEIGRNRKKANARKEKRAEKKQLRKTTKPTRKRLVAKIGLAPSRAVFLTAVRTNALKLAKRLAQAYRTDRTRVESLWTKLGGKTSDLKSAIEHGAKTQLGVVVAATALAAAAPIVIAVVKLFGELKSDKAGDNTEDQSYVQDAQNTLSNDASVTKDIANLPEGDQSGIVAPPDGDGSGSGLPTWVLPVAVGGAALLLLPKLMKGK